MAEVEKVDASVSGEQVERKGDDVTIAERCPERGA